MTGATFANQPHHPPVTQLRLGRVLLLLGAGALILFGGAVWLLQSNARLSAQDAMNNVANRPWMNEKVAYTPDPPPAPMPEVKPLDTHGAEHAALRAQMEEIRRAVDALQRRPQPQATAPPPKPAPPPAAPAPKKAASPMLYVAHEPKEDVKGEKEGTYTLMPGTYLPCFTETAMNSDVGDFTFVAVVHTTVYDTETGRIPLIMQGSKIVGEGQGSQLLYGNERIRTVSLTLSRRHDKEPIDLGPAPLTDQAGIAGLTGKVNSHWFRLFGAVFIGGALRGGTQALQTAIAGTGPVGQVGGGIGQTGNQVIQRQTSRALDTRPTIEISAGQGCNVVLTKPLQLTVAR